MSRGGCSSTYSTIYIVVVGGNEGCKHVVVGDRQGLSEEVGQVLETRHEHHAEFALRDAIA